MSFTTALYEEILNKEYSCIVCYNNIGPKTHIWSCKSCFRAFDLSCIKKWSEKDLQAKGAWRCPHCLTEQTTKSIRYKCWCGKVDNPSYQSFTDPHSCGQTCGAQRSCPHPCPLPCHNGPHLDSKECMFSGPIIKCYCGKKSQQTQCSLTNYDGFSCNETCNRRDKICGHKCVQKCHKSKSKRNNKKSNSGPCGPCKVPVTVSCYCGKTQNSKIPCHKLPTKARKSIKKNTEADSVVMIACKQPCNKFYSCNQHKCKSQCHLHDTEEICPLQPLENTIETCFCGKTQIKRSTCLDKIASCSQPCNKLLPCGHTCPSICHEGPCKPCKVLIPDVLCRCKSTTQEVQCYKQGDVLCETVCKRMLDCNHHCCKRQCCPLSKYTIEDAEKKKQNVKQKKGVTLNLQDLIIDQVSPIDILPAPVSIDEESEALHMCLKDCDRFLNCGVHKCKHKCHTGNCQPCKTLLFDEWQCTCGKTTVEPPIVCGTRMPSCHHPCIKAQACGHPAQHSCHSELEPCPPCSLLIQIPCVCGKSKMKEICSIYNNPETRKEKRCLKECGKKLPCGHICKQPCCGDNEECPQCTDICTQKYEDCSHVHKSQCHYPNPCPDLCPSKLEATCYCGVLKVSYYCGEDVEVGCNEVCLRESYSVKLLTAFEQQKSWFLRIEKQIRNFVEQTSSTSLWFQPMNRNQRLFVYELLEHSGLRGEGVGERNNRAVRGFKTFDSFQPKITLSKASTRRPQFNFPTSAANTQCSSNISEPNNHHAGDPANGDFQSAEQSIHSDEIAEEHTEPPRESSEMVYLVPSKIQVPVNKFSFLDTI